MLKIKYQNANFKIVVPAKGGLQNFDFLVLLFELSITRSVMRSGRPYPKVTVAFLPSSLRMTHSFPLGFSPYPPVSVSGTEPLQLSLEVFRGDLLNGVSTRK